LQWKVVLKLGEFNREIEVPSDMKKVKIDGDHAYVLIDMKSVMSLLRTNSSGDHQNLRNLMY
jgi:hypothetical protein